LCAALSLGCSGHGRLRDFSDRIGGATLAGNPGLRRFAAIRVTRRNRAQKWRDFGDGFSGRESWVRNLVRNLVRLGRAVRASGRREVTIMNALLQEYLPLVIFLGISAVIGLALLVAPFIVAYRQPDPEKLSAYECGFNAFDDARMKFDVRFYLVAILFIIFDLEVAFLFPWAITFGQLGSLGFWSMMLFLAVLTVGFIYEWKKGALEWD
jgi:NADH-quinone oxidoreductase subunit A